MKIEHLETKHIFHVEYKGDTFQVKMDQDANISPNDIMPISRPSMKYKDDWAEIWKTISDLVTEEAFNDNIKYI